MDYAVTALTGFRHIIAPFIVTLVLSAATASPSAGGVIFEDNFDGHADWNRDGSLNGATCTPRRCATAPKGWDGYRSVPSTGAAGAPNDHDVPVVSIQRPIGSLADHTGGAKGKALVVYQASDLPDEPGIWKGDGQIAKVFPVEYQELYIRYWVRAQPGWQSVPGGALKTFRITHWPGPEESSNIFNQDNNHPTFYLDQSTYGAWAGPRAGFGAIFPAYRCSASPDDYFCTKSGNKYQSQNYGDDWLVHPQGSPAKNYADSGWHRYDIHIKVNRMGKKDGIVTISYDGKVLVSHSDIVFLEPGTTRKGFNAFMLGGNSHNNYAPNGHQWYAIDDVVVSTTPIPDDYAIRGRGADVAQSQKGVKK